MLDKLHWANGSAPIRAVIFDVGGVLIRGWTDAGRRKWEERLEEG